MSSHNSNNINPFGFFHPEENINPDLPLGRFEAKLEPANAKITNECPSDYIKNDLLKDESEDYCSSGQELNDEQIMIRQRLGLERQDLINDLSLIDTTSYDLSPQYKSPQYIENGSTSIVNQISNNDELAGEEDQMCESSTGLDPLESWIQHMKDSEGSSAWPIFDNLENSVEEYSENLLLGYQLETVVETVNAVREESWEIGSDSTLTDCDDMPYSDLNSVEASNSISVDESVVEILRYNREPLNRQSRSRSSIASRTTTTPYSAPVSTRNRRVTAEANSTPEQAYNRSKPGRKPKMLPSLSYEEKVRRKLRHILNPDFTEIVSVDISNTSCMSVVINIADHPILNIEKMELTELRNTSVTGDPSIDPRYRIALPHVDLSRERTMYRRDLSQIVNAVSNIQYYLNLDFGPSAPYIPQWTRYEIDEHGEKMPGSRAGACPYCKETKFYDYAASGYLSHLGTEHGVYSTGYLVPEGLHYGEYANKLDGMYREIEIRDFGQNHSELKSNDCFRGIQCPQCHVVIRVGCQTGKKELLNYIRHFKNEHKRHPAKLTTNQVFPIRKPTRANDGVLVTGWYNGAV